LRPREAQEHSVRTADPNLLGEEAVLGLLEGRVDVAEPGVELGGVLLGVQHRRLVQASSRTQERSDRNRVDQVENFERPSKVPRRVTTRIRISWHASCASSGFPRNRSASRYIGC
jgi:hypothetical protein